MKPIEYDPQQNRHTLAGARAALEALVAPPLPSSLLDVGCGTGVWLRAALDLGIEDVWGIDGVRLPPEMLHVSADRILIRDLRGSWAMDRRFDLVLCLEVAEHLPPDDAPSLIEQLTRHGDRIFFSAANVWQGGQHHVNCEWPAYWQALFNRQGFVCRDSLRWRIWDRSEIEPWYRQNLFLAERDPAAAGLESRIPAVIHPDCMPMAFEYWRHARQSLAVAMVERLDRAVRRLRRQHS